MRFVASVSRRLGPPLRSILLGLAALAMTGQGQSQQQLDRIAAHPDLTPSTRLTGHLPRWVTSTSDVGPAPADTPLRISVVLARTPVLQAAFDHLLADQQDPASNRFHQWLTPTQIGEQFGPTPADVEAVVHWLTTAGLQLTEVSPARNLITVTGPAAAAAAAFSTTFHLFTYNGERKLSATSEPAIPAAFASVVTAIDGLADLPLRPMHHAQPAEPRAAPGSLQPRYSNSTNVLHYVFPGDFAAIYDFAPITSAGYTGTGIKIAVIGRSQIAASDITELEGLAGLPSKPPNVILVPGSVDPGVVPNDTGEATLDVGRVTTSAPGAQIDLVLAANVSGGLAAGLQYNVNSLLDPIMSLSYGLCESAAGASNVTFFNTLFSQAAAEGISTFVSSGDAAAAGCSPAFSTPTGTETLGMGNYLCASSFVTCVGGTQFNDANANAFWSPTNTTTYVSAIGYIPEGAWNEPTTTNANGATVFQVAGTGSGPSAFIPKPSWQVGIGVPNDGARDIPDLSFTASGHDGFFACFAYLGSAYDCSKGGGVVYSGTSVSAPSMAAIAAILSQRLQGTRLGNLNPLLYRLAASTPTAFHDATPASSGVVNCTTATATICNNSVASPTSTTGGLAGYPLTVGYDLVTGLGSLDVGLFIKAAASPTLALSASPTTLTLSSSAANTATSTITATTPISFTGSVSLTCAVAPTTGTPPSCSLSPTSLTFNAVQSASAVLTLATITPRARPTPVARVSLPPASPFGAAPFAAALFLLLLPRTRHLRVRLPRLVALLPLALLLAATLLPLSGCGGTTGSFISLPISTPSPTVSGTTPGTYQVTVTATSGTTIATANVTLTVN